MSATRALLLTMATSCLSVLSEALPACYRWRWRLLIAAVTLLLLAWRL